VSDYANLPPELQDGAIQLARDAALGCNKQGVPLNFNYADRNVAFWGAPDTDVNGADLLVCLQFVLGLKTPTNEDLAHGDLYPIGAPDGQIGLPDDIQLQKLVLF